MKTSIRRYEKLLTQINECQNNNALHTLAHCDRHYTNGASCNTYDVKIKFHIIFTFHRI